jgi:hypothetical protein
MSEEVKAPALIRIDEKTQQLVAKDNSELMRLIRTFMKGTAFPKTLDTEEKVIAAWQVAASLKIPPMVAMQNMAVIHGSVCIWGQLPKALAEATGEIEKWTQFYVDKDQKKISFDNQNLNAEVWACVVQVKRKGRDQNEYFFSVEDAAKAGLLNKSGPWKDHRKVMLARRTSGMAVKFEFPDALMGVSVAEYDLHTAPDLKDVTPSRNPDNINAADQLWEKINGTKDIEPSEQDDRAEDIVLEHDQGVPGFRGTQN